MDVVKAAPSGSILANLLLVPGLCFVVGGLTHGTQRLDSERARGIIVLMVLSVAALAGCSRCRAAGSAAVLAAFVSDLFVHALEPAMQTLHLSDAFAVLVIVAIAVYVIIAASFWWG